MTFESQYLLICSLILSLCINTVRVVLHCKKFMVLYNYNTVCDSHVGSSGAEWLIFFACRQSDCEDAQASSSLQHSEDAQASTSLQHLAVASGDFKRVLNLKKKVDRR